MGCASSKPQVNQPTASVPSSVTPSGKAVTHEKSVRFADEPTEISDKRTFSDDAPTSTATHSTGVLQDVMDDGPPKNNTVNNVVQVTEKIEVNHKNVEVPVAEVAPAVHVPEPVAVVHPPQPAAVVETRVAKVEHVHVEVKHEAAPAAAAVDAAAPASSSCSAEKEESCGSDSKESAVATTTAVAESTPTPTPAPVEAPVTTTTTESAVPAPAPVTTAPAAPAAAAALVVPDKKKGYMLKQGHMVKNWKNRFFILEEGMLTYYESSTANAPYGVNKKGEMSLREVTVSESKSLVTLSTRGKGSADLVLEIKYPNERDEWMAAFRQHTAWLKATAVAGNQQLPQSN